MNRIENTVDDLAQKVNEIDLQIKTNNIPNQGVFLMARYLTPMNSLPKSYARQRTVLY